jgi:shikimate dehydrogenase
VPFKESSCRDCAHASGRARQAEVVNTLVFTAPDVYGDTTDGPGLVADLTRNLRFELRGRQVLLMGAGGAARGVVPSLLEAGVTRLVVANRTLARAQAVAARFAVEACGYVALEGERFDLVVNATSAVLADAAPRLPASIFKPGALAYDMVYGRDTPFLLQARAVGACVADGLGMLVEQAAESFFIWRGVRPETRALLERLRAMKNAG